MLFNPPVNPWTSNVKKNSEGRPNVSKWFYYSANSWVPSLEELLYLILVCPFFSNRLKRVLGSQDDILVQLLCCGARCWVHSLWGSFEGKSTRNHGSLTSSRQFGVGSCRLLIFPRLILEFLWISDFAIRQSIWSYEFQFCVTLFTSPWAICRMGFSTSSLSSKPHLCIRQRCPQRNIYAAGSPQLKSKTPFQSFQPCVNQTHVLKIIMILGNQTLKMATKVSVLALLKCRNEDFFRDLCPQTAEVPGYQVPQIIQVNHFSTENHSWRGLSNLSRRRRPSTVRPRVQLSALLGALGCGWSTCGSPWWMKRMSWHLEDGFYRFYTCT